jgi:HAD superfamily hydrolase (TIGR01509 family)
MPAPDLVIFDCDGVLIDSEAIAVRVDAALLTRAGYEIDAGEMAARFAGQNFAQTLLQIEREAGIALSASLIGDSDRLIRQALLAEVTAIAGAHEAVEAAGRRRCVCSNSSLAHLQAMLGRTGLHDYFGQHLYSARDVPGVAPKPAPDIFRHAAKAFNADPARTFVIEDSAYGVTGARAAGMRVIGFTGGAHSWPGHGEKLIDAGAETVIRRLADFAPMIAALSELAEPL